ncbi:MAG: helicase associated domain-containing protein [Bacilli bacterium]|nr:helicase associated domain-containing protein [Bacilli bacterium]
MIIDKKWLTNMNELIYFYKKYNTFIVPQNYKTKTGASLFNWLKTQKKHFDENKLSEEQINMFNKIGYDLKKGIDEEKMIISAIKNFYYYNKHLIPNKNHASKNGIVLYDVLKKYRRLYSIDKNSIPPKIFKVLNDSKMIWDEKEFNWMSFYKSAALFYKKNNHLNISSNYCDIYGDKLGKWIKTQRENYNNYRYVRINNQQIELLNRIGMIWDLNLYNWNTNYNIVFNYYKKFGSISVPGDLLDTDGKPIRKWIIEQKESLVKEDYSLSEKQVEKLKLIGISLESIIKERTRYNETSDEWLFYYNLAKDYYIDNGSLIVPTDYKTKQGFFLGYWISNQRKNKDRLNNEQLELLDDIGMIWDTKLYSLYNQEYSNKNQTRINNYLLKTTNQLFSYKDYPDVLSSVDDVKNINSDFYKILSYTKK